MSDFVVISIFSSWLFGRLSHTVTFTHEKVEIHEREVEVSGSPKFFCNRSLSQKWKRFDVVLTNGSVHKVWDVVGVPTFGHSISGVQDPVAEGQGGLPSATPFFTLLKPRNIFAIFGQAITSVIRAHGGVAVQITLPIIHSAHLASYER